jgi:Zn-dependent M28 family amino/carboxypeptidase
MDVVINHEQELFVVSAGKGYSTLGFEHVFKQLKQLVARLNLSIQIREDEKGTIGQYADFQRAINEAAKANLKETWFNLDTPVKVRRILEQYRRSGKAIRLFYGDVEGAKTGWKKTTWWGKSAARRVRSRSPFFFKTARHGVSAFSITLSSG